MDEGEQGGKHGWLNVGRYRKCRVSMERCLKNQGVDVERAVQEMLELHFKV